MPSKINQVIKSGRTEIERELPKILRRAIEGVYKTPFRMLVNIGKQQFNKIKRIILRQYTISMYNILFTNKSNNN